MEATEPTTLESAAEMLVAPEPEEIETEEVEAEEVETDEVEMDAEATDETDEVEAEAEADDVDDVEDDAEQEADEEPEYHTVKVNGEDVRVTYEELTRGYAGQTYIQQGMSEVAEARKKAEATRVEVETAHNALSQERQNLATLVQHLHTTGIKAPVPIDPALAQTDPIGFMQAQAQYQADVDAYQATMGAIQQQTAQAEQLESQNRQKYVQEKLAELGNLMPEYTDPERAQSAWQSLGEGAAGYGFNTEEISQILDPRHVQVLHDAIQFRKTKAKTDAVTAKAAKARPVVKPKAKKAQNPARVQRDKQRQKLKQTNSLDDAVALIFEN